MVSTGPFLPCSPFLCPGASPDGFPIITPLPAGSTLLFHVRGHELLCVSQPVGSTLLAPSDEALSRQLADCLLIEKGVCLYLCLFTCLLPAEDEAEAKVGLAKHCLSPIFLSFFIAWYQRSWIFLLIFFSFSFVQVFLFVLKYS